jgi:CheY-like chemotaxis protein
VSSSLQFLWGRNLLLPPDFDGKHDRVDSERKGTSPEPELKVGNRLLMIGLLRELALYRAAVLQQSGFAVTAPTDIQEALRIIETADFDAVVLSYTLPNDVVQFLADQARAHCPDCPIIAITHNKLVDRLVQPDAIAIADEGPEALLAALHSVLRLRN